MSAPVWNLDGWSPGMLATARSIIIEHKTPRGHLLATVAELDGPVV